MYDRYILFYYSIDQQTNRNGLHTKYHTLLCPRMTHTFYRTFRKLLTDIRNTGTSLLGNINLLLALYCSLLGSPPPPAGRMLKVIVFSKHGSFVLQTNSSSFIEKKGNRTKLQNKQPPPLKTQIHQKGLSFCLQPLSAFLELSSSVDRTVGFTIFSLAQYWTSALFKVGFQHITDDNET